MTAWYTIHNINNYDTPCLVVYPQRINENIGKALDRVKHAGLLRPHVKTNKMPDVCRMMMERGITKFKCATIAEAEMLAMTGARDVLLAYQPVGPKMNRFLKLVEKYPDTLFSCTIDNQQIATELSMLFYKHGRVAHVFIDVNTGMNRTGASETQLYFLADVLSGLEAIKILGVHAYDGHVKDRDLQLRQKKSDEGFSLVKKIFQYMSARFSHPLHIVTGGSPSFATHFERDVECSPGTFVFWDWGYKQLLPEEPYEFAAVVISRVISIVDEKTITIDLGYKSVASENPLPRLYFLNAPGVQQLSQSEEHLVLQVEHAERYKIGDVLYGIPVHICPTVALYDEAYVAENNLISGSWPVTARVRKISI